MSPERSRENTVELSIAELSQARLPSRDSIPKLMSAVERVKSQVIGREELLHQTLYGLLTGTSVLTVGNPGLAKTLFADALFAHFGEAEIFRIRMIAGTSEEHILGPYDLRKLENGEYFRNTAHSLLTAQFAYLDELFDANDRTLRAVNIVLDRKAFQNGDKTIAPQLLFALATTNLIRFNELTQAVVDRFPCRCFVQQVKDSHQRLQIDLAFARYRGRAVIPRPEEQLSPRDVATLQREIGESVEVPPSILFLKNELINEFEKLRAEGRAEVGIIPVTDRTATIASDFIRVSSFLRSKVLAEVADLDGLGWILPMRGTKEVETFEQSLRRVKDAFKAPDLAAIDRLATLHNIAEETVRFVEVGRSPNEGWFGGVLESLGLTAPGEFTLQKLMRIAQGVETRHPSVNLVKQGTIAGLNAQSEKLGGSSDRSPFVKS